MSESEIIGPSVPVQRDTSAIDVQEGPGEITTVSPGVFILDTKTSGCYHFLVPNSACPQCGSESGQWRGYRTRKNGGTTHRRRCNGCSLWFYQKL